MFIFDSYWEVLEFKLILIFITGVLAVIIGNAIYEKMKNNK